MLSFFIVVALLLFDISYPVKLSVFNRIKTNLYGNTYDTLSVSKAQQFLSSIDYDPSVSLVFVGRVISFRKCSKNLVFIDLHDVETNLCEVEEEAPINCCQVSLMIKSLKQHAWHTSESLETQQNGFRDLTRLFRGGSVVEVKGVKSDSATEDLTVEAREVKLITSSSHKSSVV